MKRNKIVQEFNSWLLNSVLCNVRGVLKILCYARLQNSPYFGVFKAGARRACETLNRFGENNPTVCSVLLCIITTAISTNKRTSNKQYIITQKRHRQMTMANGKGLPKFIQTETASFRVGNIFEHVTSMHAFWGTRF